MIEDYATGEIYYRGRWMDREDYEAMLDSDEYQQWLEYEAEKYELFGFKNVGG